MCEAGGEGAELEPARGADVGEAEDVHEEVGELGVRVRFAALAAHGVVVLVRLCVRLEEDVVGVGAALAGASAGRVREEEEGGAEDEEVGGDVGRAGGVREEEGVGEREDGDGGPEAEDDGAFHVRGRGRVYRRG